jgi:alpha-tubulin suppressor-like RCC1 family protein
MQHKSMSRPLWALLCGLVLAACVGEPESAWDGSEEFLGTQESELCSGLSVTTLTIAGVSSYQHELAGSGSYAVSTGANAARIEYYLDGVLIGADERVGSTGTWYASGLMNCGNHTFLVKAYPMVVDSIGNRTTCYAAPKQTSKTVLEPCSTIIGGGSHSLGLRTDGTVRAWGYNANGQVGDGTTTNRFSPVTVSSLGSVLAISGAGLFSVALKPDGTVWAWGNNAYGQLGDGTTTQRNTPVKVSGLSNVSAIAAGVYHMLALKNDGTVWAWGYNAYGQVGNGTTTNRLTPVQVLTGVTAIGAGGYHSLAVKTDGTVRAWGDNTYGQVGDGTTTQRNTPVKVSTF